MNYTVSTKKKKKNYMLENMAQEKGSLLWKNQLKIWLLPQRENCCFKVTVVPLYAKYTKIKYHLTKIPTYEGNHMSREIIIRDLVNQRA